MIVDTVDHIGLYKGIDPNLDVALDFLSGVSAGPIADGRREIDGTRVYATVSSYRTESKQGKSFEAHRTYIDVQCLLAGSETITCLPLARCSIAEEYSEARDVAHLDGDGGSAIVLTPTVFAVLFPQDAHRPGDVAGTPQDVRKLVIKVRASARA